MLPGTRASRFVAGIFKTLAGTSAILLGTGVVAAFDADLDTTFSYNGLAHSGFNPPLPGVINAVAVQPDGMIVLAGTSATASDTEFAVLRFDAVGGIDPSFDGDGKAFYDFGTGNEGADDVAIQPDGKIVVVGDAVVGGTRHMAVARFNSNGSFDGATTVAFAGTSVAHGVAIQADGKIVIAGKAYNTNSGADFAVARLNSNLTIDSDFGSGGIVDWDFGHEGYDCAYAVAIRGDGKIVLAGTATLSTQSVLGLMVFSASGGPQSLGFASFAEDAYGLDLALQPDGKAVVAGRCDTWGGDFVAARFNTNATLDTGFHGDGKVSFSHLPDAEESAQAVIVQHNGKIVVGGYLTDGGMRKLAVVRWLSNGQLDASFAADGPYVFHQFLTGYEAAGNGIAQQPDGKLIVAGITDSASGQLAAVARFHGDEALVFTDGFELGSSAWWSVTIN